MSKLVGWTVDDYRLGKFSPECAIELFLLKLGLI